jgi:hypothetical protein
MAPPFTFTRSMSQPRSLFTAMVCEAVMTPADVHDSVPVDDLVRGDEEAVYADKAYDSAERRAGLRGRGIEPRIMHKARHNRPLRPWQAAFNKAVAPIRGRAPARGVGAPVLSSGPSSLRLPRRAAEGSEYRRVGRGFPG